MNSLQRDPTRFCTSVYMPIPLGEKIMTEIEGVMVDRKTRACIHGMKRRKNTTRREKNIGDFLIECAEERTKKTVPSEKAKRWGKSIYNKNLKKRKEADQMKRKGKR